VFIVLFLLFFALYPARGTIFNYLWGLKYFGRAVWNFIYRNPNDLAAITLLQFSMAVGLLKSEHRGWFKRGALAATIVLPLVILFTQSRGALIALIFVSTFAVAKEIRKLKSFMLIVVMAAVIAMAAPSGVWDRLGGLRAAGDVENLGEVDPDGSAEQRFQIWRVSWLIIADNPISGTGFGTYPTVHERYAAANSTVLPLAGGRRDTHSTYFNLAATVGIPGLAIFLITMGVTLLQADRVRRRCRDLLPSAADQLFFLELGLIGFLMAGIFASYAKISFLWIHLALLYAVTKACESDLRQITSARRNVQRAMTPARI
jgi:O-antigen ligase